HHSTVIKVGHALVVFLTFLQNENAHGLAGEHDRLQRIGEFIDVQDFSSLQLRYFIQIEIVGDDLALVQLGQFDKLEVGYADRWEIVCANLHPQAGNIL